MNNLDLKLTTITIGPNTTHEMLAFILKETSKFKVTIMPIFSYQTSYEANCWIATQMSF